jgi:hypothetical protein
VTALVLLAFLVKQYFIIMESKHRWQWRADFLYSCVSLAPVFCERFARV